MIKASDVEGLMKRYRSEGGLAKAEAMYLTLRRIARPLVAEAIHARYGSVKPLDEALGDLKSLGLEIGGAALYLKTEDTGEDVYAAVSRPFVQLFVPLIEEEVSKRPRPSPASSKILYLLLERGFAKPGSSQELSKLREAFWLLYGEPLEEPWLKEAVLELMSLWAVEFTDGYRLFYPHYLHRVAPTLRRLAAKVKVTVEY
ncbi:MAG: hypothetical protein N3H31_03840 [Candidatus Nezhaarchaeota archaeon]|nr:hypothetical protein [Candidatus Nezhaarchaeota archaeon]